MSGLRSPDCNQFRYLVQCNRPTLPLYLPGLSSVKTRHGPTVASKPRRRNNRGKCLCFCLHQLRAPTLATTAKMMIRTLILARILQVCIGIQVQSREIMIYIHYHFTKINSLRIYGCIYNFMSTLIHKDRPFPHNLSFHKASNC